MLEKGLDFSPTQSFINKVDLRMEFNEFITDVNVNGILGTKTKVVSKSRYSKVNIPEKCKSTKQIFQGKPFFSVARKSRTI